MRQTRNAHEGTPRLLRTLRNPASSGAVSCVVAFPDGKHLAWYVERNPLPPFVNLMIPMLPVLLRTISGYGTYLRRLKQKLAAQGLRLSKL